MPSSLTARPSSLAARPADRTGFTLVEAVMAMAISGLILAALTSLILVASDATPNDNSPATVAIKSRAGLDNLATDLQFATSITALTSTTVTLEIPDRDNDDEPDEVHYDWTGVAGAPLLRKYAGDPNTAYDTSTTVIPSLKSFVLIPDVRTTITTVNIPAVTGNTTTAEALLASYESTSSTSTFKVSSSNQIATTFTPTLPAGTTAYRITRIAMQLRQQNSAVGVARIDLTTASSNRPTSTVLFSQSVSESALPTTWTWYTVSFAGCPSLSPSTAYALSVRWVSDTNPCRVRFRNANASTSNGRYSSSNNNGSSWTASASGAVLYRVYGVADLVGVNTPASTSTVTKKTLMGLTVRATPNAPGSRVIDTYFPTANEPEAP